MVTKHEVVQALVSKYGRETESNPKFDRKKAWDSGWVDDPTNPELIPVPYEKQTQDSPWIVFTASDGFPSFRVASFLEIAEALVEAGLAER